MDGVSMAKCKICKTEIPEGTQYCKNCLDKGLVPSNESYLDSLLNSVKNTAPAAEIYKKKTDTNPDASEITSDQAAKQDSKDEDFKIDPSDLEDFEHFNPEEDLSDFSNDVEITDEDLFGRDISDHQRDAEANADGGITEDKPDFKQPGDVNEDKTVVNDSQPEEMAGEYEEDSFDPDLNELLNSLDSIQPDQEKEASAKEEVAAAKEEIPVSDSAESSVGMDKLDTKADNTNTELKADQSSAVTDKPDTKADNTNAELKKTDQSSVEADKPDENDAAVSTSDTMADGNMDSNPDEEQDDFLSLLNQISPDDPVADDVKAIGELMNDQQNASNAPSDVGDVFSDALKVVTNLNDPNTKEAELPDKKGKKSKKDKKPKKEKKNKKKQKQEPGSEQNNAEADEKPKKGLFKRLFGNVEDKNAKKKSNPDKTDEEENPSVIEISKQGKPKKNKKAKKGKTPAAEKNLQNGENQGKEKPDKETVKGRKKKKEKKPKKLKKKEGIQVIDELDEDVGRINRLGAAVVFIFFGLLALLLISGSNAVTYALNIQHATAYFDNNKYNQAYDKVNGMKIKDEDIEIYEKIQTVMFVNKQLNSYNNYYTLKEYPQALDSLLKGLKRYDKYIKMATMLGIKPDMDYVRKQILAELKREFNISEQDALKMINIDNQKEYSSKVYQVAAKNITSVY